MTIILCPFLNYHPALNCVYKEGSMCDEIESNPGNSDAWCYYREDKDEVVEEAQNV